MKACNLLTLKALYSRTLKSAQETASHIKDGPLPDLYTEDSDSSHQLSNLLARDDIQAVIIALPIVSQPQFIEAALSAGKHVLAEKPIAKDVATAKALIERYHQIKKQGNGAVTLSIAENFRFMPRFQYAGEQVRKLGRVTHFSVKVMNFMKDENKYYKTEWRAKPEYQGGFLLDGGVHHAAGTRMLLSGQDNAPASVRAFTSQVQQHLPPIDTVTAIVKTASGATGTFQHSAGTLMSSFEWDVACEAGSVKSVGDVVTVTPKDGSPVEKAFEKSNGVKEEVESWAKGIVSGTENKLQSPEEALGDLEFMEKMFTSGERDGEVQTYELQR